MYLYEALIHRNLINAYPQPKHENEVMKKSFFLLISILAFGQLSFAQLQKHELSISAGLFSSNFFDAMDYDIFTDQMVDLPISKTIGEQTSAIFFTYRFFPIQELTIGFTAGFERIKGEIQLNGMSDGMYYNDYVSGALELDYRYLNRSRFQMYSGIGIGVMFNEEKNETYLYQESSEEFNLAYQVNAIGIRYGRVFGVFAELGYGYKGLLKFGLNIQL